MENIKIEVNCSTGEVKEVALTPAEITLHNTETLANAKVQADREAEATAKEAAKADLLAKLGITAEEAKLLLG